MSPITVSILLIGGAILLVGVLLLLGMVGLVINRDELHERIESYAEVADQSPTPNIRRRRAQLARWRMRINNMLSALASEDLALQLTSANWPITETEYILIRFASTLAAFLIGWAIFRSPISGIGAAVLIFFIPPIVLSRAIQSRRTAFERQLIDVLVLVSGAVRAGYSLPQSLDVVVKEMRPPASDEFRRVIYEISLGLPFNQAMTNLHDRMASDDLYLLVTAININYQVGGNLVTMLDAVTNTIRDRIRLFSEVRALTSQQRMNTYILSFMPIGFVAILSILNPTYISRLFTPGITLCFPIGALVCVLLGNFVIRKLAKIQV